MKKSYIVVIAAIFLIGAFVGTAVVYQQQQVSESKAVSSQFSERLEPDYAATMGDPNARVTIVEFFDPACEACKTFYPLVKRIMNEYPGKVRLVMRYAPLHAGSDYVVTLLEAARQQGKFWETLEAAYDSQSIWAAHGNPQPKRLWMQLKDVNLDWKKTQDAMQSPAVLENVKRDIADQKQMGISKTPTFFVNGKPLVQFGYKQLRRLVEAEVQDAY